MATKNLFIAGQPYNGVGQLEIPLNDNGKASTSEKAKFLETTIENNAAAAGDILKDKLAYVNGEQVAGTIPTYSTKDADISKTISYKGQTNSQTQPTVTFNTDNKYLTTDLTVTAPSIYDLTTVGKAAFPFDLSQAQINDEIIANNKYYITEGTLSKGGMEDIDTVIQNNGDEQTIFTLRAANTETGQFVNLYSKYGKRVYVTNSTSDQYPAVRTIANDSNFIPNNIVDGVKIFGLTGSRVIPNIKQSGTVLTIS